MCLATTERKGGEIKREREKERGRECTMSLRMTCAISFYYGNSHTRVAELGGDTFTHRRFHTETLFMHTHTDAFPHRDFYTEAFTHRRFYTQQTLTQTPWNTDAFTHRRFYTQTLLHTDAFTHKHFYTQTLSHTEAFTHRLLYTQTLLHTAPLAPLLIVPLGVRLPSPNCDLWGRAQLFRLSESGPTKRSFCGYNAFCEGACWSVHASILPWWTEHLTKAIHAHTQGYTIGQLRIRKLQCRIRKLACP